MTCGASISRQTSPTCTRVPICNCPCFPPLSKIAVTFSYTRTSRVDWSVPAGTMPGRLAPNWTQVASSAGAFGPAKRALKPAIALPSFSATACDLALPRPSDRNSAGWSSSRAKRSGSRVAIAATASAVTSSAEICFHESITPSSFGSNPQRLPPVWNQRYWSALPL